MEIVLKDKDQNDILSPTLTQWDQGVTIMIRDFLYPTDEQRPYLHFYNSTKQHFYAIGEQTEGNELQVDTEEKTLTCRIPNQLLTEAYPITVHVYLTSGGSATNIDNTFEAHTVYTATIGVEPRMKPDGIIDEDTGGEVSAQYMQALLSNEIAAWNDTLNELYGTAPLTEAIACYYNTTDGKMYSDNEYITEIVGDTGKYYRTTDTGILYLYEDNQWKEWSLYGTLSYAKTRADACDAAKASMDTSYATALNNKETALNQTFAAALDGCVIRVANSAPTADSYSGETKPVITFVIEGA